MKILIATDNSEYSRTAIEKCCDFIGNPKETLVKILSVYEAQVPMAAEPFAISAEYYQRLDEFAHERAKEAVNDAVKIIRERCPDIANVTTADVELGRPAEMILETAKNWGADLIMVGSHGRGFWGRLTLGSVSDTVVHHAPCSVLVVRT